MTSVSDILDNLDILPLPLKNPKSTPSTSKQPLAVSYPYTSTSTSTSASTSASTSPIATRTRKRPHDDDTMIFQQQIDALERENIRLCARVAYLEAQLSACQVSTTNLSCISESANKSANESTNESSSNEEPSANHESSKDVPAEQASPNEESSSEVESSSSVASSDSSSDSICPIYTGPCYIVMCRNQGERSEHDEPDAGYEIVSCHHSKAEANKQVEAIFFTHNPWEYKDEDEFDANKVELDRDLDKNGLLTICGGDEESDGWEEQDFFVVTIRTPAQEFRYIQNWDEEKK